MSEEFIKFGFTGGVISANLVGRDDLEKYELGVLEAKNWFINYQGGASTRPGTQFADFIEDDSFEARIEPFRFNSRLANTYVLVFTQNKIRFVQDNAYALEAAKTITAISGAGVFTSATHGYSNGDWVKLSGIAEFTFPTYVVRNVTTNTFTLQEAYGSAVPFVGPFVSGTVSRVYTLTHPYDADDLKLLTFSQNKDVVYITHTDYAPRKLSRFGPTNWTLTATSFDGNTNYPAAPTLTPSVAGAAGVVFGITSVDLAGQESRLNNFAINEVTANYTITSGQMSLSWPALSDVQYYNVYRSIIYPTGADATLSQELGYLGRAVAPEFHDINIVPDFTTQAPLSKDPFNPGAVLAVNVTNGGSGYGKTGTTVSITGGVGFVGRPVVNAAGEIVSVMILQTGKNFTAGSTVSFGGLGTGATATVTVGPATGTWPQCSALFQQRRVYAGTDAQPMGIFASRPGQPENFDSAIVVNASDSYEYEFDGIEVTPIKFLVPSPSGLLAFTDSLTWLLRGAEDQIVSPLSAVAEPAIYFGCADVPPLQIGNDVLFVQNHNTAVQAFNLRQPQNQAQTRDLSILSADFFIQGPTIESWTYAQDPFRLVWASRSDGTFLSMTYVADQNVAAWAEHFTKGYVRWLTSIPERKRDRVYMLVERIINGNRRVFLERMAQRQNLSVENQWAVDCGLSSTLTTRSGELTITGNQVTAAPGTFSFADVGKHLRAKKGRALIQALVSTSEVTVDWQIPLVNTDPPASDSIIVESGDWSTATLFSSFGGLWHLEGSSVDVLADGSHILNLTVTNGSITLPQPASFVIVGLSFTARLKTLPLSSTQELITRLKKRASSVAFRVQDSRGLFVGTENSLYEQKGPSFAAYSSAPAYLQGLHEISLGADWNFDASVIFEKRYPTNASILGYVLSAELGDV